jgi:acetyltransferase-like isoleucine patch superfamily enzyme
MIKSIITEGRAWCDGLVRVLPGGIGHRLRRFWLRRRFDACGNVHFGAGCEFIAPEMISLGENANLGRNAFFTAEGGAIHVGANTAFNQNVHINASVGGTISIGEGCLFGPNVVLRTANHCFTEAGVPIREQGHVVRDIRIGNDVWLGANVVVVGGAEIGDGAVVGAGAVVTKSIPAYAIAVGVPARMIRLRDGGAGHK